MSEGERLHDPRIPPQGSVPQAERMFRVNWIAAELRSPSGIAMHSPDYVSRLGRAVRLVDLRTPEELTGPLGYIPGSDWVPHGEAVAALDKLPPDDPVVLVSRGGERAGEVARALEARGHRFVSALMGGIVAWRQVGLSTIRDAGVLARVGAVREADTSWQASKRALTRDDIAHHLGDPLSTRWIKLAALLVSGRLSCVDGRDDSGVVGTPGGDAGDLLLTLAALERVTGARFTEGALRTLLLRRNDAFGTLYFHTDVHASNALIKALRDDRRMDAALEHVFEPLEWRRFMRAPPAAVRPIMLEHVANPAHVGCGHLRLAMLNADAYGVRRELVEGFVRVYLSLRWEGVDENEIAVLPGGHAEGAVVNVLLADGAEAFSRIPLVSPMAMGSQMFINHPQVSAFLRAQLVRFFARQRDVVPLGGAWESALTLALESIGSAQMARTLATLAGGLPLFDATFDDQGGVTVVARGAIPSL